MANTKRSAVFSKAEFLFKLLFLLNGFLQNCNLTYRSPVVSVVQWGAVGLGAVLIVYRLIFFRRYLHSRGIFLLIAFSVSYAISAVLQLKYGWYDNFRMLIFMVYQFGILYAFDLDLPLNADKKQFDILSVVYIVCSSLLTVLSFVFLFIGYSDVVEQEIGPTVCYGFVWGRLFGAYWDPNIGAAMAVLCIVLSVMFFLRRIPHTRVWLSFVCVLQVLYIMFSDSRTGRVLMLAAAAVLTVFLSVRYLKITPRFKKNIVVFLLLTLSVSFFAVFPSVCKTTVNAITTEIYQIRIRNLAPDEVLDEPIPLVGREDDIKGDITNRRTSIWGSAIEIWKQKPVFGVSRYGIVPYAQEHLPDTYIVNNDHMIFDSMHNLYFDILVSQGAVGLIIVFAFALHLFIFLVRNWKTLFYSEDPFPAFLTTIFLCVCCCTLVMTEMVYVISPISTMMWMSLSYLVKLLSKKHG